MTFKGLLYVKHGRVGTKSEGPDYWLQTYNGEHLLALRDRHLWEPDFELEFYSGRIVQVEGKLDEKTLRVTRIWALPMSYIPREDTRPHLGDAIRLSVGERISFADAPVEVALLAIPEDSRCPTGARCIWEGQAVLELEVIVGEAAAEKVKVTLRAGHEDLALAKVGDYKIEGKRLDPYPTLGHPTTPEKSVATLVVTRG